MSGNRPSATWRKCGHPRTIENSVGHDFYYGCRTCATEAKRVAYYKSIGVDEPPLPVAYRNALRPSSRRWTNIGGKYVRERIRETVDAAEPLTRACYVLIDFHNKPIEEISRWLDIDSDEIIRRRDDIARQLSLTELQDRQWKNWPLIQQFIDEGVTEADMKAMLGISQPGWDRAKRLGRVRV